MIVTLMDAITTSKNKIEILIVYYRHPVLMQYFAIHFSLKKPAFLRLPKIGYYKFDYTNQPDYTKTGISFGLAYHYGSLRPEDILINTLRDIIPADMSPG